MSGFASFHKFRVVSASGLAIACLCISGLGAKADDASTPLPSPTGSLSRDYCDAFLQDAQKARDNRARAELQGMQNDIAAKLKELDQKTALLQDWVGRRQEILAQATDAIVKIYQTMDASSAATELSKLDDLTASAILRKLNPKKTSAILVEMEPKKAAMLVAIMAADSKLLQGDKS